MPTIEEQIVWWTRQAAHDLEMAACNRANGFHDGCALMCQQSVEKNLKALWMRRKAATPPKVHQCVRLAEMLESPQEICDAAGVVERDYMGSRYPDAAKGVPFERFFDEDSHEHIEAAEEVQRWVLQQLAPKP